MADGELNEVYFEFHAIGQQIRVAAIDGATGTEIVFAAPQGTPDETMKRLGMAKLRRRLGLADTEDSTPKDNRRGILV